ncbi:hypothetical protein BsWGS_02307 [Bradybaena similaris]
MADWDTSQQPYENFDTIDKHSRQDYENFGAIDKHSRQDYVNSDAFEKHSRQSSQGSGFSGSSKENSNQRMLILSEGNDLASESITETTYSNAYSSDKSVSSAPVRQPFTIGSGYGTAKAKAAKSPFTAPPIDTIPVEEISIPNDGNLSAFTSVQMANFLKHLRIDERIVSHLFRKSVDGKRFGKMTDSELDTLGMNNPVVIFFRSKTSTKTKKKGPFML